MKIIIENATDSALEASISGEVDADNCHELGAALLNGGSGATSVVLNMDGVTFLDSSALSELLRIHKELAAERKAMSISGVSHQVRRILEITGLLDTFGLR